MATHVTIGVNKETHKKLGKLASLTHRTRANTVEWLVEKATKEIEIASDCWIVEIEDKEGRNPFQNLNC